ncbi:MAG: hypothetical protein M3Z08_21360 [Chloroflexota bacterium]|nr:hypothetical protein [Chloroflexota bacterium]
MEVSREILEREGSAMAGWYDQYQQGLYQGVYDELLSMQDRISEPPLYEEALLVMRTLMKRVRYNIELLLSHLQDMGYLFGEGRYESLKDKAYWEREAPVYQAPTPEIWQQVNTLEQRVGPLPHSLKCWYEEVGSVNLVGLFPSSPGRVFDRAYGSSLDPLFVYATTLVLQMVAFPLEDGTWEEEPMLPLAPDEDSKYRYSGSGPYYMLLPSRAFDVPVFGEPHDTTFVDYLRICFRWGGFPGLEKENRLTPREFAFLTKDLLLF